MFELNYLVLVDDFFSKMFGTSRVLDFVAFANIYNEITWDRLHV